MTRGAIIGGSITALRAVRAAALGSRMSARTLVVAGRDPGAELLAEITVTRRLYPNVEVRIGTCVRRFMDEIEGPLTLRANESEGRIEVAGAIRGPG